ncbi:MAG: hypothetical protein HY644_11585 [Acidobacteria bacterium]|nr:hypothetical protein [Acidobacteriota bacterium]
MRTCRRGAWLVVILALTGACLKRVERVSTPAAKRKALTASREQLMELVNRRYSVVRSIKYGRLGIQMEGFYLETEKKESYPKGSGYMVVQRPHWILMNINNPLTHSTVAAMAANGRIFQVFVPRENKYVTGSVDVEFEGKDPVYNIRPQHVVEAVFVQPLQDPRERSFFVNEDSDAVFSYYVISEFESTSSQPRLLRRLWIERSDLRLVRQQWYGTNGELISDAGYPSEVEMDGLRVFLELSLVRPTDRYRLRFTFAPDAIKVNEPIEESAFAVRKPPGAELVEVKAKTKP